MEENKKEKITRKDIEDLDNEHTKTYVEMEEKKEITPKEYLIQSDTDKAISIPKEFKENLRKVFKEIAEENEILRIQIKSREREIGELKKELDEIHSSISYKVGRWIAETKIGGAFKSFLKKFF